MKRQSRSGKLPLAVQILLPLLLALLCGGVLLLASIRPYEIAKTYLRIGFMDSGSTNPNSGASGLNIVETDIDTDYTGATSAEGDVAVSAYGAPFWSASPPVCTFRSTGAAVRSCWKKAPARHRPPPSSAAPATPSSAPMSTPFSTT